MSQMPTDRLTPERRAAIELRVLALERNYGDAAPLTYIADIRVLLAEVECLTVERNKAIALIASGQGTVTRK